jgi:hypothetical protein
MITLVQARQYLDNANRLLGEAQARDDDPFVIANRKGDVERCEMLVEHLETLAENEPTLEEAAAVAYEIEVHNITHGNCDCVAIKGLDCTALRFGISRERARSEYGSCDCECHL